MTSSLIAVDPVDPLMTEILADFPSDLFNDNFYYSWELIDRYGREWVIELAHDLGLEDPLREPVTLGALQDRLNFVPAFSHALSWIVRGLEEAGHVAAAGTGDSTTYALQRSLPPSHREAVRRACLETDPANQPTLDLLDAAARAYPAVARGEVKGQEALFGLGQTQLWLDYFSNANPIYAVNNHLAAHVAVLHLAPGPLRILEVGAGAGSGSEALLAALTAQGRLSDIELYHFTEPSPFFRRRAERGFRAAYPDLPWQFGGLDLDEEIPAPTVEREGYDLIYAVNVIHVARDLDRSLPQLRAALRPGGWLVAAESIRPHAGRTISTEMIFQILEDFWDVELDPERRPTPGFLTPEQWTRLFEENGFVDVEVLPDHYRIREVYPRFCTGVVCGRA
ncbi:MAG: methyltransferase [Thermoanaerobaculia bacterium]|nr:methyltransferase [Thermoanaerobaculia bacterium]